MKKMLGKISQAVVGRDLQKYYQIEDFLVNNYEEGYFYSADEIEDILDRVCEIMDANVHPKLRRK